MGENENTMSLSDVLEAGFARFEEEAANTEGQSDGYVQDVPTDDGIAGQSTETAETDGNGETNTMMNESAESSDVPAETPVATSADTSPAPAQAEQTEVAALRAQNAQLMAMVRDLHGSLAQQRQAVQQQSQVAEEAVNNAAQMNTPEPPAFPTLDFAALQYMSPEDQQNALAEYQRAVQEATIGAVRQEMAPVISAHEQATREAEEQAAREAIYGDSRFPDFREHDAEITRILNGTPELRSVSAQKARLLAGLINRGMRSDPRRTMTADEIVAAAEANPDAMRKLEIRRAQEVQQKNENLPRLSASQGMTGAAPVPEHEPKTFAELVKNAGRRLGIDI